MRENRIHNLPYEKVGENEPICIADEVPFEIPESWEWARLSGIVFNRGQMTPSADFCYIDIGSIDNKKQQLSEEENIISAEKAPSRARKVVAQGDILYSTVRPYLHNMCIINKEFSHQPIASTGFAALVCHSDYFNEFLFYYLMSPEFDAYANDTDNAKGVAYPAINDAKLYQALIPVPPYSEQIRIVTKIKKLLPYIEKYANAYVEIKHLNDMFPEQLKKSILQEAVQGKLVPQDSNDEPASVLLERIRAEKEALIKAGKIKRDKHESVIFRRDNSHYEKRGSEEICIDDDIPFDCPQSWAWCRMGDLISVRGGKRLPAGAQLTTEKTDHVYIRVTDMKNGTVDLSDLHYISDDIYDSIKNYIIRSEDVYIVIVGSTIGKAGIVPYELDGMNLTENAARLTPILVNRDYLLLAIQTDLLQKQFIDRTNQVGQPKLALERLKTALIPLPPLNEQQRIIETYRTLVPIIQNA